MVLARRLVLGVLDVALANNADGTGLRYFVVNAVNVAALMSTLQVRPLASKLEHALDVTQLAWLVLLGNNLGAIEQHPTDTWGRPLSDVIENAVSLSILLVAPAAFILCAIVFTSVRRLWLAAKRVKNR